MSVVVPRFRPIAEVEPVRVSLPVSGTTWYRAAELSNWLQAQGGQLIPWCCVGATIPTSDTLAFPFHLLARPRAVSRVWLWLLEQTPGSGVSVSVTLPDGSTHTPPAASMLEGALRVVAMREELAARASSAGTLSPEITAIGAAVKVIAVSCYELARGGGAVAGLPVGDEASPLEAVADDQGVDLRTVRASQPIISRDYRSLTGIDMAYQSIAPHVRRWHFYWSAAVESPTNYTAGGLVTTSTTEVAAFPLPIKVQGSKVRPGDTDRTVHVATFASCDGDGGAIVVDSGVDSVSIDVGPEGLYEADLAVDCTDLSDANGGAPSDVEIRFVRKPTATTIKIAAIGIYEE